MTELGPQGDAEPHAPSEDADEPYVVVARRYRPQKFSDLIGQENVATALSNAIQQNRVGHAYLFTGARGVGKTSAARILAKALNCVSGPTSEPCQKCDICVSVGQGEDVDVLEIDGASNRGIDEIRDLRHNVAIRPSRARFKIYIIDEVHMLTREAFNALLKTLEEPPEHVKFVFCTTEPEKVPVTIQSRCQRFDFSGIRTPAIAERLREVVAAEGVDVDDEAIDLLARRAAGSMRDSQSLLEQLIAFGGARITPSDVHAMLGSADDAHVGRLIEQIAAGAAAQVVSTFDEIVSAGADMGQLLVQLVGYLRDCLVIAVGADNEQILNASAGEYERIERLATALGPQKIMAAMQVLDHAMARLRVSTHERTLCELALLRICFLSDLEDLADSIATFRKSALSNAAAPDTGRAKPRVGTDENRSASADPTVDPPEVEVERRPPASPPSDHSNGRRSEDHPQRSSTAEANESPPSPSTKTPLNEQTAATLWRDALEALSGFAVEQGGKCSRLEIPAPNRLVVGFIAAYDACKAYCEREDRVAKLAQELSRRAGHDVRVEFVTVPGEPEDTESGVQSSRDPAGALREKSQHPLVRRASDLFDARPISVEEPDS